MIRGEPVTSRPEVRVTPELAEEYRQTGAWRDVTLYSYLSNMAETKPDTVAAVSIAGDIGERVASITYAEMESLAGRLAAGLHRLGVGPGDTVSVMVANRLEFQTILYAILRLGAVYSGIPINYGKREAAFMLRRARAKVFFVSPTYRGTNLVAVADELDTEVPELEHVVFLNDPESGDEDRLTLRDLAASEPLTHEPAVDPGSLAQIGFTSGTTGEPKGVMNTHQTLDVVLRRWVEHIGDEMLGENVVNLVPSPVGHHTGFVWGALLTPYVGGTAVYLDRWVPEVVAEVSAREGVTQMISAPTFLQDLARMPGVGPETFPSLRMVSIPGAPIPRAIVPTARELLNCFVCPSWGMTEYGIGISGAPHLPQHKVEATDGVPVRDCEVRVMRGPGEPADQEEIGELEIRGPGLFIGYYDRPDFTDKAIIDGWFQTGDQAMMDAEGYISLLGRTKDIIIRGGMNIPVYDVENVLHHHPAVLEVSVIGTPDERLGERACAVLVVDQREQITLESINEFLLEQGLAKAYLPERLEIVEELPKTMSGKVRKVELRKRLSEE